MKQLNADDGGNRKFICVQLPEQTEENSVAYKAGYKNICDIAKTRISRAGDHIKIVKTGDELSKEQCEFTNKIFNLKNTSLEGLKELYQSE